MAVRFVVNGFFRSGTTWAWETLRSESIERTWYYEPLHPDLSYHVHKANGEDDYALHRTVLWEEYRGLPSEQVGQLLRDRPRAWDRGGFTWDGIAAYFRELGGTAEDVGLQINRGHAFLGDAIREFQCEAVHIIRNPMDVYDSMRRCYVRGNRGSAKDAARVLLFPYGMSRRFEQVAMHRWLYWATGRPSALFDSWSWKATHHLRPFPQFVANWVISNYQACLAVETGGVQLRPYERLLSTGCGHDALFGRVSEPGDRVDSSRPVTPQCGASCGPVAKWVKALGLEPEAALIEALLEKSLGVGYGLLP